MVRMTTSEIARDITRRRPPLVLTMKEAGLQPPDELHWIRSDGTTREFAVIDKARLERLLSTASAAFDARYELVLTPKLAKAVFAHQTGDLDPLP